MRSGGGGGGDPPTQPIPREKYPRILFIWGLTRVLPVTIESMSITEQKYDALLNPVQAEVSIGLAVVPPAKCSDDVVAKGAFEYSNVAKEAHGGAQPRQHRPARRRHPALLRINRMFLDNSRYARVATVTVIQRDGSTVSAVKLRRLPPTSGDPHAVIGIDRLDIMAQRQYAAS